MHCFNFPMLPITAEIHSHSAVTAPSPQLLDSKAPCAQRVHPLAYGLVRKGSCGRSQQVNVPFALKDSFDARLAVDAAPAANALKLRRHQVPVREKLIELQAESLLYFRF